MFSEYKHVWTSQYPSSFNGNPVESRNIVSERLKEWTEGGKAGWFVQKPGVHCPSHPPRACSNSHSLTRWCHPNISSSVAPFSFCPQSFPASGFFRESALCIRRLKYWSFSFSISPSNEHPGLISFQMDWLDLLAVQGTLKSLLQHHSSKASILSSAFFMGNSHIHTWLLEKPWTDSCQAPLSIGFPRQEYWNGLPFLSRRDLSNSGIESVSPALAGGFFTTEPSGKPNVVVSSIDYLICERCGVYPFATVLWPQVLDWNVTSLTAL